MKVPDLAVSNGFPLSLIDCLLSDCIFSCLNLHIGISMYRQRHLSQPPGWIAVHATAMPRIILSRSSLACPESAYLNRPASQSFPSDSSNIGVFKAFVRSDLRLPNTPIFKRACSIENSDLKNNQIQMHFRREYWRSSAFIAALICPSFPLSSQTPCRPSFLGSAPIAIALCHSWSN